MNNTLSTEFISWTKKYSSIRAFTEADYDLAISEAEILRENDSVTEIEWIQMVKIANFLLIEPLP